MASLPIFFLGFLVLGEREEHLGLYEVLGALLEDLSWAQEHPQPCDENPWPGVQCEIGDENPPIFHVTKIHIGPDTRTPPCKSSASLSSSLLKLPYLKNCRSLSITIWCIPLFPIQLSQEKSPQTRQKNKNLRVPNLSQNNLQGKIPREIGGLVRLEQLDLSYNNISGEIPQEIGGLGSLTILDLSWNAQGPIPPDVGQFKRLVLFDQSQNLINGPIPDSLSGLEILDALSLDNNKLNGIVPISLGTLPSLDRLNLSNNQLSGALSLPEDFIERLRKRLDVRGNNGLCAINPFTPLCLNASKATNDTALAGEEEEPNVSERMKPFGQYPVENNSSEMVEITNVSEYEAIAKEKLPKMIYDYYASGAEDQWTLKENESAFSRILFRPRILIDVSKIDLRTTVLGFNISMPIMIAPTAMQKMAHPEGEYATARAASAADTIMTLSSWASSSVEEVASTGPGVRFLQLYVVRAAQGQIPVFLDGGVRRGTDVFKALALGASGIGRPVVFSLAADGEAGVRKVLQMLRDEFELTMALSGCRSLKEITRNHIITEWDRPRIAPRL
ncbi:hypothetical protein DVH24_017491 [Malus domestica]|uniref:FMN hydroxy acid dehydrogenase domain-containing protein n=1 Tax=Malus domestica TaxID=3750 RepID=A0A498ISM6_MALDO|nr:hypothetical protein DVH24_017491 [Malus domestica]